VYDVCTHLEQLLDVDEELGYDGAEEARDHFARQQQPASAANLESRAERRVVVFDELLELHALHDLPCRTD
jgi:hypothetical protein